MIYEMSFAYNASFRLNREISFCMFAKISAGQIKFASIRSHRQQTNLFRKSNHELLHCTHPRHLHRLLCCFCILFSSSSSLLLSFTAAACFTKARFRWLHPERHCAGVCHVTLAICDIVANIKLGNVHADVSSRTKVFIPCVVMCNRSSMGASCSSFFSHGCYVRWR